MTNEHDDDVLEKAIKAQHAVSYGHWQGTPIIAIGPQGGKIIGYTGQHEPIYANSHEAVSLHSQKMAWKMASSSEKTAEAEHQAVHKWLSTLGIKHASPGTSLVAVNPEDAKKIEQAFGLPSAHPSHSGGYPVFHLSALLPHIGQPLVPHAEEHLDYGATMAAGDASHPAFPKDLSTLKEVPAGVYAGSHGNKVFQAPNGKKYIFKGENPTIARAEEATSRLSRLILGVGKTQDAKYVQLAGKDGVLINLVEHAKSLGPEHKTQAPPTKSMQAHFEDIIGQHVLDWVTSNHDAHGDNFLISDGKLIGIDKGQAWKLIGKDKLSVDYNPNPSTQVYSFFWNQIKEGSLSGDPLPTLQKVFANIAKISDEQFKAIVAPYVAFRAGQQGIEASSVEKQLLDRFHEAKSNWEWFLGQIYPEKAVNGKIAIPGPDAPAKLPASGLHVPGEKIYAPGEKIFASVSVPAPSAPVVAHKPAGFPQKKGKVTVHHPGNAAPEGWPGAYPGPGYKSTIDYKGKEFEFSFDHAGGALVAYVIYPDGSVSKFDSPNKAADSVYLWSNGLPLTMTAAEKKAKGISYSATKMLNLAAFAEAFKEHGKQETPASMTVAELEKEKIIPVGATTISSHQMLSKMESGPLLDKSVLPVELQDKTKGKGVFLDSIPGTNPTIWIVEAPSKYHGYKLFPDGGIGDIGTSEKPPHLLWEEQEALEKPFQPKVESIKPTEVQNAVQKVTIKKKGHEHPVSLEMLPGNKFKTTIKNKASVEETKEHASLSAASDHVWDVGQGFQDTADYTAKTGNKKIPSGGGKKFWGLTDSDLAEKTVVSAPEPDKPAPKVKTSPFGKEIPVSTYKDLGFWLKAKPGSIVSWQGTESYLGEAELITAIKQDDNIHWTVTIGEQKPTQKLAGSLHALMDGAKSGVYLKEPGETAKSPHKFGDSIPSGTALAMADQGSQIKFQSENNSWLVVKNGANEVKPWAVQSLKGDGTTLFVQDSIELANWLHNIHKAGQLSSPVELIHPPKAPIGEPTNDGGPSPFDEDKSISGTNWEWFDDADPSKYAYQIATALSALPKGTEIKFVPSSVHAAESQTGKPVHTMHAIKIAKGNAGVGDKWVWIGGTAQPTDGPDIAEVIKNYSASGVKLLHAPKENEETLFNMILGPSKTVLKSIKNEVPEALKASIDKIETLTDTWTTTTTKNGQHKIGEKPTGWPSWIPPPGVWIKGSFQGKPIYFTTAVTGYGGETSLPGLLINFAVSDGTKITYDHDGTAPLEKAGLKLASILQKHTGWPTDIEAAFPGILQNDFPVGSTKATVEYDKKHATDHAVVPGAPDPNINPMDLYGPASTKPVTVKLGLLDAWKHLPEIKEFGNKLKLKPGSNPLYYNLCFDNVTGISTEEIHDKLKEIAAKYGLTPVYPSHPKYTQGGSFMTVKTSEVMASKVDTVLSAGEVPPTEVVPNNFETMPDEPSEVGGEASFPKKIYATWDAVKKHDVLVKLPVGSVITTGTGEIWTKNDLGKWGSPSSSASWNDLGMAGKLKHHKGGLVQVAKDGKLGPAPTIPKSKPPAPAVKWVAPPPDPEAEKKKAWAKENPSINQTQATQLAWLLKNSGLEGHEVFARIHGPSGSILIGDGTDTFDSKLKLAGGSLSPIHTPHGMLFSMSSSVLAKATPEAGTMKGPDGATYPYGTTFETQKVFKTLEESLPHEQGFTKFSEYKGHEPEKYQKTVKILGNTLAHKMMAESMLKKFGLSSPVLQGTGNTMFFVSTEALKTHAGEPELKVTAKVPAQPSPLKTKPVGVALGVPNEGQPAPINRDDLGIADSIIPFRHGYSIRFGAGGVLMDGQLRMHRVQLPDGSVVNRFVGELTKAAPTLNPGNEFHFYSSSTKKASPIFSGWKENEYDPKTGVHKMSVHENWKKGSMHSSGDKLSGGGAVYTFGQANGTLCRTFAVDVPVGTNAESALAEAMGKLGVPVEKAMAHPTEDDERVMKKIQILRSAIGAQGWKRVAELGLLQKTLPEVEATLDANLKGKIAKKEIDTARVVIGHDGYHHVELDDLDTDIGTKVKAIGTHISIEGMANIFLQGGYGGQGQCLFTGNSRNLDQGSSATVSGHQDMMGGGGVGKFFRMIGPSIDSHQGSSASKPQLIIHPRVLKKTNWYAADGDTYGTQAQNGSQKTRSGAPNCKAESNEFMIENVSPGDIAGAIVQTEQDRQTLLGYFQTMGMSEINGCPVEKFVVIGSPHYHLNASIKKLPLLAE